MSTPQPTLNLQRAYVKGLSLELPNAPQIFLETGNAQMHLDAQLLHEKLSESIFEVVVRGTLTAKLNDKVVYLVEVQQAGIFEHKDIADEQLNGVVNVTCPSILFPYLRATVADIVTRASLAPFHVPEVNWAAMFQQATETLAKAPPAGGVH